jgi:predicted homoserine dehydrogenase-like protein
MTTRREFLGQAGVGLAWAALPTARALGANDRIRIGLIGAGDRGMEDLKTALKQPNIECVAIADIYSRRRDMAKQVVPNATMYDDPMKLQRCRQGRICIPRRR